MFHMIVAGIPVNGNRDVLTIGKDNKIPWKVPEDLRWFYKYTIGQVVIMGRKTWDSLPKQPLPGRINIVITSGPPIEKAHHCCNNIDSVISICENSYTDRKCIVIGGGAIYEQFLNQQLIREISITYIHVNTEIAESCDTTLNLDLKDFKQISVVQRESFTTVIEKLN